MWQSQKTPQFGVTFSSVYAEELGLDTEKVFTEILQDLDVRLVRLPVYWSEVEHEEGVYDWSEVDALMVLAQSSGVDVTMVVGQKVPRWPECFIPTWALQLSDEARHEAVLSFIEVAIDRYKDSPSLYRWQVENEPFFPFGECPDIDSASVMREVELVRLEDPHHPIQMTTSGELEFWWQTATQADVVGFSLYRVTWNDVFGYFTYPLSPWFYRLRSMIVDVFVDDIIVSELQAEPWFSAPIETRSMGEWYEVFSVDQFEENVAFASEVGVSEVYLWGAEWWYLLKESGNSSLWNAAKDLFSTQRMIANKHPQP